MPLNSFANCNIFGFQFRCFCPVRSDCSPSNSRFLHSMIRFVSPKSFKPLQFVSVNGRFAQNNKTLTETKKITFYGSGNFQSSFEAVKQIDIKKLAIYFKSILTAEAVLETTFTMLLPLQFRMPEFFLK
jgi:hypothetical protein